MEGVGLSSRTLVAAALFALAASVQAGEWRLDNSISLRTVFSDNINLRAHAEAGSRLELRPRLALSGEGRRVNGKLEYAPAAFLQFGANDGNDGINHQLNAVFGSELVRNRLFLDSRATAGLVTTSVAANNGADALNYRDNASQVYTLSLSPYARQHFGSFADLLLRLDADRVESESSTSQINSTSLDGQLQLSSGRRFARFPWSLSASRRQTRYDVRTDQRDDLNASLGYRIDRRWRVDGNIGYQDNRILTSRSRSGGMSYSGTLFWTPSPRTQLEAQYGRRYFGTFWSVSGSHHSRRTTINLSMNRDISNARSLAFNQDFLSQGVVVVDQVNEDYLSTRVALDVAVSGRRTDLSLRAGWDDRSYEISANDSRVLSLTLGGSRRLTPRVSGNLHVTVQDVQASQSNDSLYTEISVGLSRSLGRYSHIRADLSRRQRSSDTAEEYTENRLGLTLSTRMF